MLVSEVQHRIYLGVLINPLKIPKSKKLFIKTDFPLNTPLSTIPTAGISHQSTSSRTAVVLFNVKVQPIKISEISIQRMKANSFQKDYEKILDNK
jgi:hypothetical protein